MRDLHREARGQSSLPASGGEELKWEVESASTLMNGLIRNLWAFDQIIIRALLQI